CLPLPRVASCPGRRRHRGHPCVEVCTAKLPEPSGQSRQCFGGSAPPAPPTGGAGAFVDGAGAVGSRARGVAVSGPPPAPPDGFSTGEAGSLGEGNSAQASPSVTAAM